LTSILDKDLNDNRDANADTAVESCTVAGNLGDITMLSDWRIINDNSLDFDNFETMGYGSSRR